MSNLVSSFEKKTVIGFEDSGKKIIEIPIDQIQPDTEQVRTIFDEEKLDELADSIKEHGILNPIHVYQNEKAYVIITGERRYRASKKTGQNTVPCIVHEQIEDKDIKALQLIENLQREDLSAIETAKGFKALRETGLKQRQIANSLGVSESTVTKYLAIVDLKKMPNEWLEQIEKKYNHASLKDLYEIASANKRKKPQLYNHLMKQAKVEVEIEVPEEKPKKEVRSEFSDEELQTVWDFIIKKKRKTIQNLTKYISLRKIQSILNEIGEDDQQI